MRSSGGSGGGVPTCWLMQIRASNILAQVLMFLK